MKISILLPDITNGGGTERAIVTLANMLHKKRYDITIISLFKVQVKQSYYNVDEEIEVLFLDKEPLPSGLFGKILWTIKTVSYLKNFYKDNKADVIMATGHNINWLLPLIRPATSKIIACEHIVYESIPVVSRLFMSLTYKYLDNIVLLSEKAKSSYVKYSKTTIIPNSLSFKADLQAVLENKEILLVGRLSPEKGLERLIPIANLIKDEFFEWKIIIIGDGDINSDLYSLYKKEGLQDYIVLKGGTKDVKWAYLNSSIYIMTSHFEAFPMVLLEAQSCGLPIVSYDCPQGPSQIIRDSKNGYLIENGNHEQFALQLGKLMRNKDLRREFGQCGFEDSKQYSEENIVKKWQELFNNITV